MRTGDDCLRHMPGDLLLVGEFAPGDPVLDEHCGALGDRPLNRLDRAAESDDAVLLRGLGRLAARSFHLCVAARLKVVRWSPP